VKYAPSGAPVAWVKEPSYFFRLSAWGDKLLNFYETHPDFILPASRRNEVMSFVKSGLQDLSVSRTSFSWGVPVPGDAAHVMYVWLDALTNYITALGYPADIQKFWPADVHMVGKDILRFHAIYWPAFLMAADLAPPKRVFAHGWWTIEGQKMSKSLGNAIDPVKLVEEFGLDAVRFFLLREVPFGQDGDFSRRALIQRLNSELADSLGNLANRTLSLIQRNCEARLPEPGAPDALWAEQIDALPKTVGNHLELQQFHAALEAIFAAIRAANVHITEQAPWALKKTDPARGVAVLRGLHDALRVIATVLIPFMPTTMAAMLDQLGVPEDARNLDALATPLPGGLALPPPAPLFRKLDLPA
jgi:methionyl-tRNA synthetase